MREGIRAARRTLYYEALDAWRREIDWANK